LCDCERLPRDDHCTASRLGTIRADGERHGPISCSRSAGGDRNPACLTRRGPPARRLGGYGDAWLPSRRIDRLAGRVECERARCSRLRDLETLIVDRDATAPLTNDWIRGNRVVHTRVALSLCFGGQRNPIDFGFRSPLAFTIDGNRHPTATSRCID
jgi:hypothetical protein